MKKIIATILSLSCAVCAQDPLKYPDVNLSLQIIDDENKPLAGLITYANGDSFIPRELGSSEDLTDANGRASHTFKALGLASYMAKGEGFYHSMTKDLYAFKLAPFTNKEEIRYDSNILAEYKESFDLKATLVVRRIKKPIPLHVKRMRLDFPEKNQWMGFDLEKGEWVKPWGSGVHSDLILRSDSRVMHNSDPQLYKHSPASLVMLTGKGGGFHKVTEANGFLKLSEMKMPYSAPLTGYDEKKISTTQAGLARQIPYGKNKGYFFQTRVVKDGDEIVAANYGKIIGAIKYIPQEYPNGWFNKGTPSFGSLRFTYYFNPKQNDRNLEFDRKTNLVKELEYEEEVTAP
jgi:hypothetical protein